MSHVSNLYRILFVSLIHLLIQKEKNEYFCIQNRAVGACGHFFYVRATVQRALLLSLYTPTVPTFRWALFPELSTETQSNKTSLLQTCGVRWLMPGNGTGATYRSLLCATRVPINRS